MRSAADDDRITRGVNLILDGLGCSINSPDFEKTAERVLNYYTELLTPEPLDWATFPAQYDQMVVMRGHECTGICPHHLLPVEYKCYAAYVPEDSVVGLSKLARVFNSTLTRPMMQEELTHLVADTLMEKLNPKGVGVVVIGKHGCMKYRGVRSEHSDVVTSMMKGCFFTEAKCRSEFLKLVRSR